jgi:BON domain
MRKQIALLTVLLTILALAVACSRGRSDSAIANDIKAKMFSDPQLKDSNLQIAVQNGEVTLSGQAASEAARYEAFKLASGTSGVKKVNDQTSIQAAQAAPPPAPAPAPEPAPRPRRRHVYHRAAAPPPPAPATVPAPAPAPVTQAATAVPAAPPKPKAQRIEIPAGTRIDIRMIDSVDSSVNHTGEIFHASLDSPIVVGNQVVIPRDADVYLRLVDARSAGHYSGQSELQLELVRLSYQGRSYPLVSSTYDMKGTSRGKRTAATIGGAAAIGAVIGAIAGGGKGAAIGAGTGAGAGTVYQGVTRGKQVKIPSETLINFTLEQPTEVNVILPKATNNGNNGDNGE